VIDPTECMKTAIAEMESNLSADESLSDKDRTGLLKTTTAKTLVVLLVPPPPPPTPLPSESNAAATTVEAVPQTRLGLVTVVVHAKEVGVINILFSLPCAFDLNIITMKSCLDCLDLNAYLPCLLVHSFAMLFASPKLRRLLARSLSTSTYL